MPCVNLVKFCFFLFYNLVVRLRGQFFLKCHNKVHAAGLFVTVETLETSFS